MATVSVSYLWIALEVRGAQERAAGEGRSDFLAALLYLGFTSYIREDTLERTRVRLESSRASTRKSYAVPDIPR